jgi:hypothetical protein
MAQDERDIQLIAEYLEGTLPEHERKLVEARLAEPAFKKLFIDAQLLITGIRMQGREKLRQTLVDLDAQLPLLETKKSISFWPWATGIAATFLIIYLVLQPFQGDRNVAPLFDQYYSPYPNVVMPVTRSEQGDSTLMGQAFSAYESKQYKTAIQLFKQIAHPNEAALLYLGNSYLSDNQPEKAVTVLKDLSEKRSTFNDQATWYLALAHIRLNQRSDAVAVLEKLKTSNSSYSEKAREVIKKLDR